MTTSARRTLLLWIFALSGCLVPCALGYAAAPPDVTLTLMAGNDKRTFSLQDLKKIVPSASLTVYNPSYGGVMAYNGFWFDVLIKKLKFHVTKDTQFVFICRDGYAAVLPAPRIGRHRWLLAYGEPSGQWTGMLHDGQSVSPAPWYLVGSKKESFTDFPWPYAVLVIRSLSDW